MNLHLHLRGPHSYRRKLARCSIGIVVVNATYRHVDGLCTGIPIELAVWEVLFHHTLLVHHTVPTNVYLMDGVPYTTMVWYTGL